MPVADWWRKRANSGITLIHVCSGMDLVCRPYLESVKRPPAKHHSGTATFGMPKTAIPPYRDMILYNF